MANITLIGYGESDSNIRQAKLEEILESRLLRDKYASQVDVLDKVKKLSMLPDDIHVTVEMVANYYEIEVNTLKQVIKRHRGELESDGFKVLIGSELDEFVRYTMYPAKYGISLKTRSLTLLPRRAVLRIGMLLRDSEVAKTVRSYLLNVEEKASDKQRQQAMDEEIRKFKEAFFTPDNLRKIAATMEENVYLKTENQQLIAEVEVLTPEAESHDHYMAEGKASSVGKVAKVAGQVPDNPVKTVKTITVVKQAPKWLTRNEQNQLVRAVRKYGNIRELTLVTLMLHTSLRVQEVANVCIVDIEIGERKGKVTVRNGKHNRRREVPLNIDCREVLKRYLQDNTGLEYLFPNKTGNKITPESPVCYRKVPEANRY